MPLLWKYLSGQFLRIFALSFFSLLLLIVVSRIQDTALFISLGVSHKALFWFVIYQLPYIIPIAIPISCLVASLISMQKLSENHEVIALFSLGLSLKKILAPLIILSLFLSFLNFYINSEIATNARLSSKKMVQEIVTLNPIHLLTKSHFLKRKDCIIKIGSLKDNSNCKNILIGLRKQNDQRMMLFFAKELFVHNQNLKGKNVTLITSISSKDSNYDHLILENQSEIKTSASEFTHFFKKGSWNLYNDYLKMPLLLSKIKQDKNQQQTQMLNKSLSELILRLQIGLSPFCFTLLGLGYGLEISRKKSKKNLIYSSIISAIYIASFFLGKNLDDNFILAALVFSFPIFFMIIASIFAFRRIIKGIVS